MQFVQALLTDDQALKTRLAFDLVLADEERFVMTDEERTEYQRLAVFFGALVAEPGRFVPTGKLAETVKRIKRNVRGPAAQPSRRNKRKARQEKRRAFQKAERRNRREAAEAFNAAREQYLADVAEIEAAQAELAAKLEAEPKFNVLAANGQVVLGGIPASMIVASEEATEPPAPTIVLPDGVGRD